MSERGKRLRPVDLAIHLPLGAAVVAVEHVPELVARGRAEVSCARDHLGRTLSTAKGIGRLTVLLGRRRLQGRVDELRGRRPAPAPVATPTPAPPPDPADGAVHGPAPAGAGASAPRDPHVPTPGPETARRRAGGTPRPATPAPAPASPGTGGWSAPLPVPDVRPGAGTPTRTDTEADADAGGDADAPVAVEVDIELDHEVDADVDAAREGGEEGPTAWGAPAPAVPHPDPRGAADLPIEGYDDLAASQIVPRLAGLSAADLRAVRDHEAAGRARRTILTRVDQLLAGGPGS